MRERAVGDGRALARGDDAARDGDDDGNPRRNARRRRVVAQRGTARAARSGRAAAGLAIAAVALGGMTAKFPGAAVALHDRAAVRPQSGGRRERRLHPDDAPHDRRASRAASHRRGDDGAQASRDEAPIVVRAAYVALGMVVLQLVVASSMILLHLPPVLRSLHEATGVGIWLSCFTLAYLAHRAAANHALDERVAAKSPVRIASRGASTIRHRRGAGIDVVSDAAVVESRARSWARDLVALTKPRIISLLLVTTIAPMFVAGRPSWTLVLAVFIGGYLDGRRRERGQHVHGPRHRRPDVAHAAASHPERPHAAARGAGVRHAPVDGGDVAASPRRRTCSPPRSRSPDSTSTYSYIRVGSSARRRRTS